jgi:hypothetical protein
MIPRLRAIALPPEHGGWGFLLEALLLGLVAAPSPAGASLAAFGVGAFLGRHPFKLALADANRGHLYPRTRWALAFLALYGGIAAAGACGALVWSRGPFWLPLFLAAPPALAQLAADAWGKGRTLAAEALGCALPGALAASIALAAGWAIGPALALWAILAARAIAAILHVRARLRADRGTGGTAPVPLAGYALGLLLALALAWEGLGPWTAGAVFGVLLARVLRERVFPPAPVRPQILGMREMALGLASVLLIGLGVRLGA